MDLVHVVLVTEGAGVALRAAAELGRLVALAIAVLALAVEAGHCAERLVGVGNGGGGRELTWWRGGGERQGRWWRNAFWVVVVVVWWSVGLEVVVVGEEVEVEVEVCEY